MWHWLDQKLKRWYLKLGDEPWEEFYELYKLDFILILVSIIAGSLWIVSIGVFIIKRI